MSTSGARCLSYLNQHYALLDTKRAENKMRLILAFGNLYVKAPKMII